MEGLALGLIVWAVSVAVGGAIGERDSRRFGDRVDKEAQLRDEMRAESLPPGYPLPPANVWRWEI